MAKIVNLILLLMLFGGLSRIFVQAKAFSLLADEHHRLASIHGELDVRDATKYLISRVETTDSKHFCWRTYSPTGLAIEERFGFGVQPSSGYSRQTNAHEATFQCRFEFRNSNELRTHVLRADGGSLRGEHNRETAAFLEQHWSDLVVTQLGDDGPVEIPTDLPVELLSIRLPESVKNDFEKSCGKKQASNFSNIVYQIVYGTPAALQLLDEKNLEAASEQR